MNARHVLKSALAVIERDHTAPDPGRTFLAADEHGRGVRPLDPSAVAWTSVGAICKVAPGLSAADPQVWADHLSFAWDAYTLLEQAAEQQGYAHTVDVDRAGREAALRMFWRALQLCDPEPRRRRRNTPPAGSGSGANPKGAAA